MRNNKIQNGSVVWLVLTDYLSARERSKYIQFWPNSTLLYYTLDIELVREREFRYNNYADM